jgi:hypothetical protein
MDIASEPFNRAAFKSWGFSGKLYRIGYPGTAINFTSKY